MVTQLRRRLCQPLQQRGRELVRRRQGEQRHRRLRWIDHYLPGVAESTDGGVGMCWYDRRRDPENFLIDRECATSRDGGQTWRNTPITKRKFSPIIADDLLVNPVYMGDYDAVAADFLGEFDGFLGAYGKNAAGNPDVRISRRFGGSSDSGAQDNN